RAQRRERAQGLGEGVRGHHHQQQVGTAHRGGQVGGGAQAVRQRDAGQVARILVALVDRRDDRRVTPPQRGGEAVTGDQRRKRGAPGTGTEDRDRDGRGRHGSGVAGGLAVGQVAARGGLRLGL